MVTVILGYRCKIQDCRQYKSERHCLKFNCSVLGIPLIKKLVM